MRCIPICTATLHNTVILSILKILLSRPSEFLDGQRATQLRVVARALAVA